MSEPVVRSHVDEIMLGDTDLFSIRYETTPIGLFAGEIVFDVTSNRILARGDDGALHQIDGDQFFRLLKYDQITTISVEPSDPSEARSDGPMDEVSPSDLGTLLRGL